MRLAIAFASAAPSSSFAGASRCRAGAVVVLRNDVKWTCITAVRADAVVLQHVVRDRTALAACTARDSRGSTRPIAAAASSDSASSVSAGSFGISERVAARGSG
jgi:hypothetical protein